MQPEILETFEYQGQTLFIHLEEDSLDPDWLIVRAYDPDGRPFNKFIYCFDIESEAQRKMEMALRGEWVH